MSREVAELLHMDRINLLNSVREYLIVGALQEPAKRLIANAIRSERCMTKIIILEMMEFLEQQKDLARPINSREVQRHLLSESRCHELCSDLDPVEVSMFAITDTLNHTCLYE